MIWGSLFKRRRSSPKGIFILSGYELSGNYCPFCKEWFAPWEQY